MWYTNTVLAGPIYQNIARGTEIFLPFDEDLVPKAYYGEGCMPTTMYINIAIQSEVVWKNHVTKLEQDIALIQEFVSTFGMTPYFQSLRSQTFGPYLLGREAVERSFIYPDIFDEGYYEISRGNDELNQEEVENSPQFKQNGAKGEHVIPGGETGFNIYTTYDTDGLMTKEIRARRLVLKSKNYLGSIGRPCDALKITSLGKLANIATTVLLLF